MQAPAFALVAEILKAMTFQYNKCFVEKDKSWFGCDPGFVVNPKNATPEDAIRFRKGMVDACINAGKAPNCWTGLPAERPLSEQIQARKDAVAKFCRERNLPPNCAESGAVPGVTR